MDPTLIDPVSHSWIAVLLTLIATGGTAFGLWINYRAKAIQISVNAERAAMIAKLNVMHERVAEMTKEIEQLRNTIMQLHQQLAEAKARTP